MHIAQHLLWFVAFARDKIVNAAVDPAPLTLKRLHTLHVFANARHIAAQEGFSPELARICALAALYHDLARFDQYLQYGTFKDAKSRNHGSWGVQLLKKLQRFVDEPKHIRNAVFTAIGLHNRAALPAALAGDAKLATMTIRDADKLDILRVMAEHLSAPGPYNPTVILGLPDDAGLYGEKVLAAALGHKPALYADLRSVNDFRLLLGTWIYDMNFTASKSMFRRNGHAQRLVSALPENGIYSKAKQSILASLQGEL